MYVPLFADIITAGKVVDDYAYGGTEQFSDLLRYKCLYSGTGKYFGIKYRNKLWV